MPLDLSVLEGNDPAGFKAEALIKDRIAKTLNPDTAVDWERTSHHQGVQQNPGSVAAADSGQFHAYRKNRRHELDRIEAFNRAAQIEIEQAEFQKMRAEKLAIEAAKTEKRRAKRKKAAAAKKLSNDKSEPVKEAPLNNKEIHKDDDTFNYHRSN